MKHERINQPISNFNQFKNEEGWETTHIGCNFKNSEIKLSAMLSVTIYDNEKYVVDFYEPKKDWFLFQKTDKELEVLENMLKFLKEEQKKSDISLNEKIDNMNKTLSFYKKFQKVKEYTKEEFEQHFYISCVYQLKKGENGTSRNIIFNK